MRKFNPDLKSFDLSCFNGTYCTGDIDEVSKQNDADLIRFDVIEISAFATTHHAHQEYFSSVAARRADGCMHGTGADADAGAGAGASAGIMASGQTAAVIASPRLKPAGSNGSNVLSISIIDFPLEFTDNEK